MVAYGVLELKPIKLDPLWHIEAEVDSEARFENDQLRKLVNDELQRYGLLLKRNIVPKNIGWRTKSNEHILLGQIIAAGFTVREELCLGTFRECCLKATEVLDAMDRSQIPDTATGTD